MKNKRIFLIILSSLVPYLIVFYSVHFLKNAFAALILYNSVIFLLYFLIRKNKVEKTYIKFKNILLSVGLFILCSLSGIIIILLWEEIKLDTQNFQSKLLIYGISNLNRYFFIAWFSFINPIAEEFFWRVLNTENKYINFIRDILFAGYHIIFLILIVKPAYTVSAFFILAGISVIWRYIYEKKQNLLTVIISHAIADLSIISTILILK